MYKITIQQLEEIIDDAWYDGYLRKGEYQVTQRHNYIKGVIKNIEEEYGLVKVEG